MAKAASSMGNPIPPGLAPGREEGGGGAGAGADDVSPAAPGRLADWAAPLGEGADGAGGIAEVASGADPLDGSG